MDRKLRQATRLLLTTIAICLVATIVSASPYNGQIRPGFMTGNSDVGTDVFLDILLPLYGDDKQLFFFNPNVRFDDNDGNEQNIGIGYRALLDGNRFILGGNLYYDTMESEAGHRYKQWGVGAELLSEWVDLRANYYNVFGDDVNVLSGSGGASDYFFSGNSLMAIGGSVEQALDGFDAELSVLIPGISEIMETRVAGTYYRYDADYAKDPDGWRGRIEIRPVQAVNLSVEYRDDDLRGTDTFVGGYLEIPFSIENLFSGKNPFEGAGELWAFGKGTRKLEQRMTDKVVRDRHIVAVRSGAAVGGEVPVVDNTMIFVNQDNTEDKELQNGSFEHPYATLIQAAESSRFQQGAWIYIFSSDETADIYANTHFTLLDDQVFWGQGYEHPVYGLGGGPIPILDGGYTSAGTAVDPVITLANNNEIMGLVIQHGMEGIFANSTVGSHVKNVNIHDNIIRNNFRLVGEGSGIHINNNWTPAEINNQTLSFVFTNNQILDNDGNGIYLRNYITGGDFTGTAFTTTVIGNTFAGNTTEAVSAEVYASGSNLPLIQNITVTNTFTNNTVTGIGGFNIQSDLHARNPVDAAYAENKGVVITNIIKDNNLTGITRGYGLALTNAVGVEGYLNSLLEGSHIINDVQNNFISGNYAGIGVANEYYSAGDLGGLTASSTFSGNNMSVADHPIYSTTAFSVYNNISKWGDHTGPVTINVLGQENVIDYPSLNRFAVVGAQLVTLVKTSTRSGPVDGNYAQVALDFGGGTLGSTGGNQFTGFFDASTTGTALRHSSIYSLAVENNWWGTTDRAKIEALIDNSTYGGAVDFEPFLLNTPQ